LAKQEMFASALLLSHPWVLARDHAPPVQTCVFSPISPRSPPYTA
jgi:hypothetical protein